MNHQILYLSPHDDGIDGLAGHLERMSIYLTEVKSLESARRELRTGKYDMIISRCEEVDEDQTRILEFLKAQNLPATAVIVPRRGSVERAVRAMKLGANDVVVRESVDSSLFESLVKNAESPTGASHGREEAPVPPKPAVLIGQSRAIAEIRTAIGLVAKSEAAVLITGESGTGKEIVARSIHTQSLRSDKPFIALNSAAFPKDVIENELFGHERGAFTGALVKKTGAFELAHEGTLFFDEIAEMSPDIQAKLVRAIEHKTFRRVGGKDEVSVDVRIIAATNKNVLAALAAGELREDLYYRFSVIEMWLPPLRERAEDIPLLADHFLTFFAGKYGKQKLRLSDRALGKLCAFDWPGNVRELRNSIERAVVTCQEDVLDINDLPGRVSVHEDPGDTVSIPIGSTFEEAERKIMIQTLASVHNNKSKAARILGLSRKTLHNKLRQFADSETASGALPSEASSPSDRQKRPM